jgi:alkylated DNA nucleotide flippase Atl1
MQVRETSLQELISGMKQFRVPLFQRTYTWTEKDHGQLWRDILSQYELLLPDAPVPFGGSGHFIGSLVLAPAPAPATLPAFLVVDGQQRLTTLTLALCALREAASASDPQAYERITNQYLVNQYGSGDERWKFVPTEQDRKPYFACIEAHHAGLGKNLISAAYRFFEVQITQLGPNDEPLDLGLLERVIVSKLAIVDITAQPGDNVHRIFESLNATGVGLTQADLLRNYLFMLLPTRDQAVYREVWLPLQELLGAENLEGLARVDLRRRGMDVRDDDVYRAQQARLEPLANDEAKIEAEISDLALRARHYVRILNPALEEDPGVRRGLEFLARWRAATTHPVVMFLFEKLEEGALTSADVAEALLNIESFLVRRLLVGVSTKNLNRIFVQLVTYLRQHSDESVVESLSYQLSTERKFWASDDEIRAAVRSRPFYFYGRAEQRRIVLERLEESYGHKEQAELAKLSLTVEHIMPQALSMEWASMLAAAGDDSEDVHRERVHTLGNLTLSAYNSELSNKPFERKQQIYGDSHLSLNRALVEQEAWGRAEILARADELAGRIITTWPGPVPGAAEPAFGFDWTRMHAAVAAIPDGRWTAYADLAALAGTAPQAVGNHIANHPSLPKAWRVLTSDGRVSEGFRWLDPDDTRDPRALLEQEGVVFDADGRADPALRLSIDDLHGLLGWFDPEDDIPGE